MKLTPLHQNLAVDNRELRPCPYCAHIAPELHIVEGDDGDMTFVISCPECGARGPCQAKSTPEVAAFGWNQRYGSN